MALLQILCTAVDYILGYWLTILFALASFLIWKFKNSAFYPFYTRKFPPGPTLVPLVGFVPGISSAKLNATWWMEQGIKYKSKLTSVRIFGGVAVMINDYDMIKEYFVRNPNFSDRQDISFTTVCDPNYKGIVSTSGREWKAHRRFTMHVMKDLGMGKLMGEDNICTESLKAIDAFKEAGKNGRIAFDPLQIVNMAVSNIINSIVFNKQFAYDDSRFVNALKAMNEWFSDVTNPRNMLIYLPLGRFLMRNFMAKMQRLYGQFAGFVVEEIEEHQKKFDGEVKDLIDAYLVEMGTTEEKEIFNSDQLKYLIMDLFLAGSETTYSTLRWFILHMAVYPEVQEKIHQELSSVMGDRLPSIKDKKNTPYTDAVMCEIQRRTTLIPTTLSHANLKEDIELEGYLLPPNTPVFGNLLQVHRDPRFWKNPDQFDPGNFLDDEGNMLSTEKLIPFSIGRRSCAGEALARMELYIFFTSWVKTFQIKPETDETKPEIIFQEDGLNVAKPYKIRMILREAES